jgi:hypothetical protein
MKHRAFLSRGASSVRIIGLMFAFAGLVLGCRSTAEETVERYLRAQSLAERASFVADEVNVRAAMDGYYDRWDPAKDPLAEIRVERISPPNEIPVTIRGRWRNSAGASQGDYIVIEENGRNKIDWPASVGFNAIQLKYSLSDAPKGRIRQRLRLSSHPEAKKVVDELGEGRARSLNVYLARPPQTNKLDIIKWTLIVGKGSAIDTELEKRTAAGESKVTIDARVAGRMLVADRIVSASWHISPTAPAVEADPSALERARPVSDLDDWVLRRDPEDVIKVDAARVQVDEERTLLAPCDRTTGALQGRSGGYAMLVPATAAHAADTGCISVALAFSKAHYLPPDETTVAIVEAIELGSQPSTPAAGSGSGGSASSRATLLASAGLLAEAATALSDEKTPDAAALLELVKQRQAALTEHVSLMSVKKSQIVVDPTRFRGKEFVTSMCCAAVDLSEYVTAGPFVELNYSAGQRYNMACYPQWILDERWGKRTPDPDIDSWTEVRIPGAVARAMVSEGATLPFDHVICKQQVSGVFTFNGQIYGTRPVFYLKTLLPARPLLPGSGTAWNAKTDDSDG